MDLEVILSLLGTIVGLVITACTFIVKTVSNARAKHIAEQAIKIGNAVLPFIKEAEKLTSYTGAEKKEYVMTKANQFAIQHSIPFNAEEVSNKIEELITFTRHVNKKITPKQEAAIKQDIEQVVTFEEIENSNSSNNLNTQTAVIDRKTNGSELPERSADSKTFKDSTEQEIDDWINGHAVSEEENYPAPVVRKPASWL